MAARASGRFAAASIVVGPFRRLDMDRILALQNLASFDIDLDDNPQKSTDSVICSTNSTNAIASSCSLICSPENGLSW
jgi:hypothetical protein